MKTSKLIFGITGVFLMVVNISIIKSEIGTLGTINLKRIVNLQNALGEDPNPIYMEPEVYFSTAAKCFDCYRGPAGNFEQICDADAYYVWCFETTRVSSCQESIEVTCYSGTPSCSPTGNDC
jgi:hypothetical protein